MDCAESLSRVPMGAMQQAGGHCAVGHFGAWGGRFGSWGGRFAARRAGRFSKIFWGGLVIYGVFRIVKYCKSKKQRKKIEEESHQKVVLHCIPRNKTSPSLTPFGIKIETFFRMMDIDYRLDTTDPMGPKNKAPWITYKGVQYTDSQLISDMLQNELQKFPDSSLTDEQRAIGLSMRILFEDHLYWCFVNWRYIEDKGQGCLDVAGYGCAWKTTFMILLRTTLRVDKCLYYQGMGRHTKEEVHQFCRTGLKAFADYLGDKAFLFGDTPHTDDCAVFGLLVQFLHGAPGNPYLAYIKDELPAIEAYVARMKAQFWPDWESCLLKPSPGGCCRS